MAAKPPMSPEETARIAVRAATPPPETPEAIQAQKIFVAQKTAEIKEERAVVSKVEKGIRQEVESAAPPPETPQAKVAVEIAVQKKIQQEKMRRRVGVLKVGTKTGKIETIVETQALRNLEKNNPRLFKFLQEKGLDAFNKKVAAEKFVIQQTEKRFKRLNVKLPDGGWISKVELEKIKTSSPVLYNLLTTKGFSAADKHITAINKQLVNQDRALKDLSAYKDKEGNYDIAKYWQDKSKGKGKLTDKAKTVTLSSAGFSQESIKAARESRPQLTIGQEVWREITPWKEAKGEFVSAKGAAVMGAEVLVPFVYAVGRRKELTPGQFALFITIDAASLAIFGGLAIFRGVRAGLPAGKKAAAIAAARALGTEFKAQAIAPVNMIIHPVGTAKATYRQVANLVENLASTKKIPNAVLTTTDGTIRIPIGTKITPAEATAARDFLMEQAIAGKNLVVEVGDQTIEVVTSPFMREVRKAGGGLTHATPAGETFDEVLQVTGKAGKPLSEQGIFFANEPLPRFTEGAAFGAVERTRPTIYITSRETAEKMVSSNKIYRSTAELESILPVGAKTEGPQQRLITRIGATADKVVILLERPLTTKQILHLKAEALIEAFKAPFRPGLKIKAIKGSDAVRSGLSEVDVKRLAKILTESGNIGQAKGLLRANRIASRARAVPRSLASVTGRVSARAVREARARVERIATRAARAKSLQRAERIGRAERVERVARVERVDRSFRAERAARAERADRAERVKRADRSLRAARIARGVRAKRVDRVERVDRVDRIDRIDRLDRLDRIDRLDRLDRIDRLERIVRPDGKGDDKEKEWTKGEISSAFGFKSGFAVHAIKSPYRRGIDERSFHVDNVPAGLQIIPQHKGKGSLRSSARVISGRLRSKVTTDVGNQDIISTPHNGGRRVSVHSVRDTTGTRSHTTIKRGKSISKKHGRIFKSKVGGSEVLSRRPLRSM